MSFCLTMTADGQYVHGTNEQPTTTLRFVLRRLPGHEQPSRILQQWWRVTEYDQGKVTSDKYDWRDVPLADDQN